MKTGIAHLPLHGGKAPAWLFSRMKRLAREIVIAVVDEYGAAGLLRRLSDPFWFQAMGCILGFDWHSSGLTTTACGAIKEGVRGLDREIGFFVAGGKGRVSRKTPDEILARGELLAVDPGRLVYASRMSAKVDSAAVQDGYQLYHHVFFFTKQGDWAVVQQGMNDSTSYARRYHWLGGNETHDFVCEPHQAVCCETRGPTLNLVAAEAGANRTAATQLAGEPPDRLVAEFRKAATLELPKHHAISGNEISPDYLSRILLKTYESRPGNFEALLDIQGVGPKTLRALSLLAELVHGVPPSFRDPARFSFAHGGKDGHPFPVDRETYDSSIAFLREAINASRVDNSEKRGAFRRLQSFAAEATRPEANKGA